MTAILRRGFPVRLDVDVKLKDFVSTFDVAYRVIADRNGMHTLYTFAEI